MTASTMARPACKILLIALFVIAGCGGPGVSRGALTPEERTEYVREMGMNIPERHWQPFIEGRGMPGMTKEMLVFLYGQPDRTDADRYGIVWSHAPIDPPPVADVRDSLWIYYASDSATVRRGLIFQGDTLVRVTGESGR